MRYLPRSKSHDESSCLELASAPGTVRGRIARQGQRIGCNASRSPSTSPVREITAQLESEQTYMLKVGETAWSSFA